MSSAKLLQSLLVLAFITACEASNPVSTPNGSTSLEQQISEAGDRNLSSARNQLTTAQNRYFQISPALLSVAVDTDAYQDVVNEILPAMLAVSNSLSVASSDDVQSNQLRSDLRQLFNDMATQMLNGINTNLSFYQGVIEGPQSLGNTPATAESLQDLAALFQATEMTERFTAQLAQFNVLLPGASDVLTAIRNQQNVVINGVLRIAGESSNTDSLRQAYLTLVQSLTRPELLAQLSQLARRAYGEGQVALRSTELTPVQSNPSLVQMVVQEGPDRYRLIRVDNGRLVNEITLDSRGLSASDILYQSNVVVVSPSQQP
ncbi:MAG: hypothetical protein ACO1RX_15455 [Candidatus Sericytochromatia bacterium]